MTEGSTRVGPEGINPVGKAKVSKSPFRLRVGMEVFSRLFTGGIEVNGEENIDRIPEGRNVVLAVTHITDMDIALAAKALSGRFNLALVDISGHREFRQDPGTNL